MRHRVKRMTMGKVPIKHASTLVGNIGPGDGSFFTHVIFSTEAGARLQSGGVQDVKEKATTGNLCNIGDVVKYVNVCIECAPRGVDSTNIKDDSGWLEWALITQTEQNKIVQVTNIGVETLGVLATNFYREDCLMTGCFPVGSRQSMSVDLKFKMPDKCARLKIGRILQMICYIRGSSSTDTRTDSNRLIVSSHFKSYS